MTRKKSIHDRLQKCSINDAKNELTMARQAGDLQREEDAMQQLGDLYFERGKYHMAVTWYTSRLQIAETIGDKLLIGDAQRTLGLSLLACKYFNHAKECHAEHLKLAKELTDTVNNPNRSLKEQQKANCNLGDTYLHWCQERLNEDRMALCISHFQQSYTLALDYLHSAVDDEERDEARKMLAGAQLNLGYAYDIKAEFHTAEDHFKTALDLAKKSGDLAQECGALGNLAAHYNLTKEWDKSFNVLDQMLSIAKNQLRNDEMTAAAYCNYGDTYFKQGNYAKAMEWFQGYLGMIRTYWPNNKNLTDLAQQNIEKTDELIRAHEKIKRITKKILTFTSLPADDKVTKDLFDFYGELGNAYATTQQYHLAYDAYKSQLSYFPPIRPERDKGNIYYNLGRICQELDLTQDAVNYHTLEFQFTDPTEIEDRAVVMCTLAHAMFANGDSSDVVIAKYEEALKIANDVGDTDLQIECLDGLRNVMEKNNMVDRLQSIKDQLATLDEILRLEEEGVEQHLEDDKVEYFSDRKASSTLRGLVCENVILRSKTKGKQSIKIKVEKEKKSSRKPSSKKNTNRKTKSRKIDEANDFFDITIESQLQPNVKKAARVIDESSDAFAIEDIDVSAEPVESPFNPFSGDDDIHIVQAEVKYAKTKEKTKNVTAAIAHSKLVIKVEYAFSLLDDLSISSLNFQEIQHLDLSNNNLTHLSVPTLCSWLSSSSIHLRSVNLSFNFFTTQSARLLLPKLAACRELEELAIGGNWLIDWAMLDDVDYHHLQIIISLPLFRYLGLFCCKYTVAGLKKILDCLLDSSMIRELDLSGNCLLSDEALGKLSLLPRLNILTLEDCDIVDAGLCEIIRKAPSIERLNVSFNPKLRNSTMLFDALSRSRTLKSLSLIGCGYAIEELEAMQVDVAITV